ncbi:hypothetical protein C8Q74DRAFT_394695 [Fomes fomentarius]|nr:hypothetical protein C8Q74DRAFT_394695 [Fomes fomentarius]
MPSVSTLPECPHYLPQPPSTENLEWADIPIIDLSKAKTAEGRRALVPLVRDAFRTHGFFYGVNHGYTSTQKDRMFDIANVPFTLVGPEEVGRYAADLKNAANYQGYKGRQVWKVDSENGIKDQVELYSVNMDVARREHPTALRPFLPEIDAFARHNHFNILHPILRILALSLEVPEDTFIEKHAFGADGQTAVSSMKYFPRTEEEEQKSKNVWLKGHTDIGSITALWSQPVSGLQIMSPEGKWKWVRHIDNAVIINTGDTMDFLTGGYYKPTIHRVVQPPVDQRQSTRLCVMYFAMPQDDVRLAPLSESPVLQKAGIERRFEDTEAPTMSGWRTARVRTYGLSDLKQGKEPGVEEEYVKGIVVKHYN